MWYGACGTQCMQCMVCMWDVRVERISLHRATRLANPKSRSPSPDVAEAETDEGCHLAPDIIDPPPPHPPLPAPVPVTPPVTLGGGGGDVKISPRMFALIFPSEKRKTIASRSSPGPHDQRLQRSMPDAWPCGGHVSEDLDACGLETCGLTNPRCARL